MGLDMRRGKGDYYTRYKVYGPAVDIRDKLDIDKHYIGKLHAKDVSSYQNQTELIGGKFQRDTTRATIETVDKVEIGPDYFLYCLPERQWYRVESVAPDSHNETQRWSSRPINTTQIVIVRTN